MNQYSIYFDFMFSKTFFHLFYCKVFKSSLQKKENVYLNMAK